MHTSPDVLALMALGEDAGTEAETSHTTTCPICSQEVAELARIADVGRTSDSSDMLVAPSPQVWARISAELGLSGSALSGSVQPGSAQPGPHVSLLPDSTEEQGPSTASVSDLAGRRAGSPAPARPSSASRRFGALAVAAGLALVVGIGVGISYEQRLVKPENRVIARAQLTALPQWAGTTGQAEVTADGRGNRELVLHVSPAKPVAGTLHVWLMKGSVRDPQSMGVVHDGVARIQIPHGMSLFTYPVVDVSDEPPGDRNPHHSGDSVVRGQFV